jgi:GDP-mannose 6-dehydrogenase
MDVSIFGLGYVGTVCAACLAREGRHVIGVDVNQAKIPALGLGGRSPEEPLPGHAARPVHGPPKW